MTMFGRPDVPITEAVNATPYTPAPSIVIAYPSFGDWFRLYDPGRERGFRRDRDTFEDMKKHHEKDLKRQLDIIYTRSTGRAVMAEMTTGPATMIFPFDFLPARLWRRDEKMVNDGAMIGAMTMPLPNVRSMAAGTIPGVPICGTTVDGEHVCVAATGTGASVDIFFTSSQFDDGNESADEALLHELVHASRYKKGISHQFPMSGGYGNQEEFLAVLVANMYRSERTPTRLFDYQHNLIGGGSFLDTALSPTPRLVISLMRSNDPTLFASLARLQAPFNPIRQVDEESKAELKRTAQK